jgi:hypothetical protein
MNGSNSAVVPQQPQPPPPPPPPPPAQASPAGFVAVNARPHHDPNPNGTGASSTTRHDLLSKFHTVNDRRSSAQSPSAIDARRPSMGSQAISHPSTPVPSVSRAPSKPAEAPPPPPPPSNHTRPPQLNEAELQSMMNSPVPIPNTPSNLLPAASQRSSQPQEKDDGGPFKSEMVHRMEALGKGERILPPCDRCRRLHMDCLKNLTACMGCTKKHAKCSWREVREGELQGGFAHPPPSSNSNMHSETSDHESGDRASTASPPAMLSPHHHGYASSQVPSSNGQSTPQPQAQPPSQPQPQTQTQPQSQSQPQPQSQQPQQQLAHQPRPHPQPSPQYTHPHDSRPSSSRNSPPERERDRDRDHERHHEAHLQEAAKSSLAHASAGKSSDYQTLIAQQ